jgi:hypothetical protein
MNRILRVALDAPRHVKNTTIHNYTIPHLKISPTYLSVLFHESYHPQGTLDSSRENATLTSSHSKKKCKGDYYRTTSPTDMPCSIILQVFVPNYNKFINAISFQKKFINTNRYILKREI